MTEEFYPTNYSEHPLYNIKAVEQATGLSSATLRAWERRYEVCVPQRSDSGYRLYSDRDIAMLRWLKHRVDEGVAISQAVAMLNLQVENATPPDGTGQAASLSQVPLVGPQQASHLSLRNRLIETLLEFNEAAADRILSESFSLHGIESSCELIIAPALVELGERWHRGEISVVSEHYASAFLRRKLESLVNATALNPDSPLIVIGCAPGDWHEIGLVLLAFFLRRYGLNVIYLGQNVPLEKLVLDMQRLHPALIIMSATTEATLPALVEVSRIIASMPEPRPEFGFGGRVFNESPETRTEVKGHFLGETTIGAVDRVRELVGAAQPRWPLQKQTA